LHEQLAKIVVLSANGVGTPRLLLNSKSKLFPDGLANSSGMVGKNFMVHTHRYFEGIFDETLDTTEGPPIFALSQQFYETDASRGFLRGYTFFLTRPQGPLHHSWGGSSGDAVPWGAKHHAVQRERFLHTVRLSVNGEDLPEESNRVELDPVAKDSSGIPAARVIYKAGPNTIKMLEHAAQTGKQALDAAGAKQFLDSGIRQHASHLMGTARMGSDPKRSVVNAWNQAHGVKNLFIVDGSSFATCASVNPTSTIGALALRAADGIWERRRDWT
jgi:choline dehydrogenase-like flavoprotein